MEGDTSGGLLRQSTAVVRPPRRKTLSPSKALGFLVASVQEEEGLNSCLQDGEHIVSQDQHEGVENQHSTRALPQQRRNGPFQGLTMPKGGQGPGEGKLGGSRAWVPDTPRETPHATKSTAPSSTDEARGSVLYAPVFMTRARTGVREGGELRVTQGDTFWW